MCSVVYAIASSPPLTVEQSGGVESSYAAAGFTTAEGYSSFRRGNPVSYSSHGNCPPLGSISCADGPVYAIWPPSTSSEGLH